MAKFQPKVQTSGDRFKDFLKIFGLFIVVRIAMLDSGIKLLNIPLLDPALYSLLSQIKNTIKSFGG